MAYNANLTILAALQLAATTMQTDDSKFVPLYRSENTLIEPEGVENEWEVKGNLDSMTDSYTHYIGTKTTVPFKAALPRDLTQAPWVIDLFRACKFGVTYHRGIVAKVTNSDPALTHISQPFGCEAGLKIQVNAGTTDNTDYATEVVDKDGNPVSIDITGDTLKLYTKETAPAANALTNITVTVSVEGTDYPVSIHPEYVMADPLSVPDDWRKLSFAPRLTVEDKDRLSFHLVYGHKKLLVKNASGFLKFSATVDKTVEMEATFAGVFDSAVVASDVAALDQAEQEAETYFDTDTQTFIPQQPDPHDILVLGNHDGFTVDGNPVDGKEFSYQSGEEPKVVETVRKNRPTQATHKHTLGMKAHDGPEFVDGYAAACTQTFAAIVIDLHDCAHEVRWRFDFPKAKNKKPNKSENDYKLIENDLTYNLLWSDGKKDDRVLIQYYRI